MNVETISVGTVEKGRVPDEHLIGALANGDSACFDEIFDRYHQQIYNFIKKQLSDHESVEDLVQEVFLRVYKSAKNFDVSRKFSSWVYKIAFNEIKRHWRRAARRQTYSLNAPIGGEAGETERGELLEDQRITPEAATDKELLSRNLHTLIDQLPAKQKTVVILKKYHDLTFEEIAEICECPLSTVLSRMRYAVDKLRRWLGIEVLERDNGL